MRALLFVAVAASVVLAVSSDTYAQGKCEASQWRVSAKLLSALAKCESRAATRGSEPKPACIADAEAKFARALAKREAKGDCGAASEAQLRQEVDTTVSQLRALIDLGEASSCCALDSLCHARPVGECVAIGGTPGPAGSTCSGTGSCETPAVPGHCCLLSIGTCIGGPISGRRCTLVGGFLFENAVCDAGGMCLE